MPTESDHARLMREANQFDKNIDPEEANRRKNGSKYIGIIAAFVYLFLISPYSPVDSRLYRGAICLPFVFLTVGGYMSGETGI
ncbi:pro-apoptotic serine protease [Acrasis kona]|uniref:2 TM domain-containing transmembrane protein n=1 Tax=Acrasis kona TaxID=1008807 RepID=A0AAW2YTY4_9EUKA